MDQNHFSTFEQRTAGNSKSLSIQSWKKGSARFQPTPTEKNFQDLLQQLNDTTDPNLTSAYRAIESQTLHKKPYAFGDVIDVVNPLHHLPIVGTLYRNLTGDELHPASRIIGGSIYGGPVGAVSATVNSISEIQTGKDLGDHVMGMARGELPSSNADYNFSYYTYQDMNEPRTAGWQINYQGQYEADKSFSFAYEPVTELALSPMPPKRLIKDA